MTLLRLRVDEVHQGEQRPHAAEHCERVFRNRRAGEKVEICAIGEEKRTDISGDIRQRGRDSLFIIGASCKVTWQIFSNYLKISNLATVGHV